MRAHADNSSPEDGTMRILRKRPRNPSIPRNQDELHETIAAAGCAKSSTVLLGGWLTTSLRAFDNRSEIAECQWSYARNLELDHVELSAASNSTIMQSVK